MYTFSIDPDAKLIIGSIPLSTPHIVSSDYDLLELLGLFRSGKHLAFVSDCPEETIRCLETKSKLSKEARIIGMVTIEDVIEKIIQQDILDETDVSTSKGYSENYGKVNIQQNNLMRKKNLSKSRKGGGIIKPNPKRISVEAVNISDDWNYRNDGKKIRSLNKAETSESETLKPLISYISLCNNDSYESIV